VSAIQIGIAMSGGVDSTACAIMLQKTHAVQGFFMHLAQPDYQSQLARVEGIAARLGITLVPLAMDGHGLRPDALLKAHRATPLRGVYLQPTLHNPLGVSMDAERRQEIAAVLRGRT